MVDFASAVKLGGGKVSICGNFDPVSVMFKGNVEKVTDSVERCLEVSDSRTFIAAGCEIPRGTPFENMLQVKNVLKARNGFNACP
jgi:uroporphyrinogen decarboxylase